MAPRFKICPDCKNQGNVPVPECGETRPHGSHRFVQAQEPKRRFGAHQAITLRCAGKTAPPRCSACNGAGIVLND